MLRNRPPVTVARRGALPDRRRLWLAALAAGFGTPGFVNAVAQQEAPAGADPPPPVASTTKWVWRWGPGVYHGGVYPPHSERDGKEYDGDDDPRLSTADNPFLSQIAEFDYPGIFDACGCYREASWIAEGIAATQDVPPNLALGASSEPVIQMDHMSV